MKSAVVRPVRRDPCGGRPSAVEDPSVIDPPTSEPSPGSRQPGSDPAPAVMVLSRPGPRQGPREVGAAERLERHCTSIPFSLANRLDAPSAERGSGDPSASDCRLRGRRAGGAGSLAIYGDLPPRLPDSRRQASSHRRKGGSGVLPSRQASSPCRLDRSEPEKSSDDLNGRVLCTASRAVATPGTFIQTAAESLFRCSPAMFPCQSSARSFVRPS